MVSLLIGLLYASLQLPLDNSENKNSRNVCLSQIRENIFPWKFLLIQYVLAIYLKICGFWQQEKCDKEPSVEKPMIGFDLCV